MPGSLLDALLVGYGAQTDVGTAPVRDLSVGYGSKAEMPTGAHDVRFSPVCGRLRVGKNFFHVCSIGRCARVFGL
jgi:hypothetical protein